MKTRHMNEVTRTSSDTARNAVGALASLDRDQGRQQMEAAIPAGRRMLRCGPQARGSERLRAAKCTTGSTRAAGDIMEQLVKSRSSAKSMDDNLPALIENAVRNEIARAVRPRAAKAVAFDVSTWAVPRHHAMIEITQSWL